MKIKGKFAINKRQSIELSRWAKLIEVIFVVTG